MRRALSLSAVILLLWVGLALAAAEVICIVDTDATQNPDYTSLAAAIAGETGASPKCVTSADLVANDEQLTIECRASSGAADTTAVTISGFVTDWGNGNYVKIIVPPAYRHTGVWSTSKARITPPDNSHAIVSPDVDLWLVGLQLRTYATSGYFNCINLESSVNRTVRVEKCICNGAGGRGQGIVGSQTSSGLSTTLWVLDNLVYDYGPSGSGTRGITVSYAGITAYLYNNTLITNSVGAIYLSSGDAYYVKNNIAWGGDISTSDNTNTSHNAYNVGSDPGSDGVDLSTYDSDDIFADYASGDFSLKSGSPLIDAGIGPVLDSNAPTTDIVGTSRSGNTCDIGAFEFATGGGSGPKWNTITPAKWNGIDWSDLKWNGM